MARLAISSFGEFPDQFSATESRIVLLLDMQSYGAKPVVVVGAGLAGLTAAIHLAEGGQDVLLCEAHPRFLGGRTRARAPYSFTWNGVEVDGGDGQGHGDSLQQTARH